MGMETNQEYQQQTRWIYRWFVMAAMAVTLTLGTLWGVVGLTQIAARHSYTAPDYASIQAHGHAQLFGWVGMFIMGVGYHLIPKFRGKQLASPRLAIASFVMVFSAIVARAISQPLSSGGFWSGIMVATAIIELIAFTTFGWLVVRALQPESSLKGHSGGRFYEKWIIASVCWLVMIALLNIPLLSWMSAHGLNVVPEPANGILLHLTAFGFIGSMIVGVALRLLPPLMGYRKARAFPAEAAFWAYQPGVLLGFTNPRVAASSLSLLTGGVLIIASLRLLERQDYSPNDSAVDSSWMWYVRLAFFWFAAALAMLAAGDLYTYLSGRPVPHEYAGAYRHAVTVGFVSTLIVGVAHKLLPAFERVKLNSTRMMRWSFALIAAGNLLRVTFQLMTMTGATWAFAIAGLSGYMELAALTVFSLNMAATVRSAQSATQRQRDSGLEALGQTS